MKLRVKPSLTGIAPDYYIEPVDKIFLFQHFFNGAVELFNSELNWLHIEELCAAHNESFERIK